MSSIVRDLSLAPEGERRIEWAWRNMPLLNSVKETFEREKPFAGKTIALSVHLEAKTACLCRVLQAGGACMKVTGSNPLSTQDEIAAALAASGMDVFALHGATMEEYNGCIESVVKAAPDIIIDDGGDIMNAMVEKYPHLCDKVLGGCEETTTGIRRLQALDREGRMPFAMIAVNDADCKHLFDNRYGTGQSVFDAINRNSNLLVAGKNVVVAGFGMCGRGCALRAKGLGAKVIVTEVNPVRALEAYMEGYTVMSMAEAARIGDIFVTVTGNCDVIGEDIFPLLKDGAILCNAGHFDVEVSMKKLKEISVEKYEARHNIDAYRQKDGRILYVIGEGRLVNLAAGDGHPVEIMDMSFAVQALSARYIAEHGKELEKHLYQVPAELDQQVASWKLKTLGVSIDTLTDGQIEYLNGTSGTF